MKPIKYLILLSTSLFCFNSFPQTAEESFKIAEKLFCGQEYEQAIVLYNRIAFFDNDSRAVCFYRIAVSNFYLANYYESEDYFESAFQNSSDDSLTSLILFDKVMLFIFSGKYEYAQAELYSLDSNQIKNNFFKYHLYQGLASLGKGEYKFGKQWLDTLLNDSDLASLDALIVQAQKWDKRKPSRAFLMSLAIPGLGQLRYGYKKEALNSFVLCGTLSFIACVVYARYSVLDAVLSILPWFQRYYLGGAFKAEALANIKKLDSRKELISSTVGIIKNTGKVN